MEMSAHYRILVVEKFYNAHPNAHGGDRTQHCTDFKSAVSAEIGLHEPVYTFSLTNSLRYN